MNIPYFPQLEISKLNVHFCVYFSEDKYKRKAISGKDKNL